MPDPSRQTTRVCTVDGQDYQISTSPFRVGEWAAAQDKGGCYVQGIITRVAAGVVTIQEEGVGHGRRLHYTIPVERVYQRK